MTFTIEEAIEIGTSIGIDWDTAEFTPEAFRKGLEVELEHGRMDPRTNVTCDDPKLTGQIAWAHLEESNHYYDELDEMEEELEKIEEMEAKEEEKRESSTKLPTTIKVGGVLYKYIGPVSALKRPRIAWKKRGPRPKQLKTSSVTSYMKGSGVLFWVHALLTSKTGRNLPGVKAGFTRQRSSIPSELKKDMTSEEMVAAKEAAKAGMLWYCKIDGRGWKWTNKNGAKDFPALHECVEFVARFRNKKSIDGVDCIYAEITNNPV